MSVASQTAKTVQLLAEKVDILTLQILYKSFTVFGFD